jgi:hypothetical protein
MGASLLETLIFLYFDMSLSFESHLELPNKGGEKDENKDLEGIDRCVVRECWTA